MDEQRFRCRHCKRVRLKRSEGQRYCGEPPCQRARKNAWRREKYEVDPDYRANQRASTTAWLDSQGGAASYYRGYRMRRAAREPSEQRRETAPQRGGPASLARDGAVGTGPPTATERANSDAEMAQSSVKSGRYRLSPCGGANSDAILVDLSVIPTN